jgi:hypothetical protein
VFTAPKAIVSFLQVTVAYFFFFVFLWLYSTDRPGIMERSGKKKSDLICTKGLQAKEQAASTEN